MVDDDGPLIAPRGVAHPAPMTVAFEHFFAEPSKVFLILPLEGVANGAHPMREDLCFFAPAVHHALLRLRHHITRSVFFQDHDTDQPAMNEEDCTLVCSHGVRFCKIHLP